MYYFQVFRVKLERPKCTTAGLDEHEGLKGLQFDVIYEHATFDSRQNHISNVSIQPLALTVV